MMSHCTSHVFIEKIALDTITSQADREYLIGYLTCRPSSEEGTKSPNNIITFEIRVIEKYFTQQTSKNVLRMQKSLQEDGILKLDTSILEPHYLVGKNIVVNYNSTERKYLRILSEFYSKGNVIMLQGTMEDSIFQAFHIFNFHPTYLDSLIEARYYYSTYIKDLK
jgi:hypothetical protein